MKKHIVLLLLLTVTALNITTAQEVKPVQFGFTAQPVNDSIVNLIITAKINQGTQLFSVKKYSADDGFVSSLTIDTSRKNVVLIADSATEKGMLQLVKQPDATSFRLFSDSVTFIYPLYVSSDTVFKLKAAFVWLAKSNDTYPSGEENFTLTIEPNKKAANKSSSDELAGKSLWQIFLWCFATGLAAVFTPCVFPLIPVTVSFFLKNVKSKIQGIVNASWYSLSILFIYVIPTLILTRIFGDKIMYQISTHPITNMSFFVIFIVFGISLLGAFELALPNSWANKADQNAGKNFKGIFFMALTLVIVSFSCTGPLVSLLLGETSKQGNSVAPVIGMPTWTKLNSTG